MKQTYKPVCAYPTKLPKTILGLYRWHQKLLRDCLYSEFKKKALEKSIESINGQMKGLVQLMKRDDKYKGVITFALRELNRLNADLKEELLVAKEITKIAHDTNEYLISSLLEASGHQTYVDHLKTKPQLNSTNLLHGVGWIYELEAARQYEKKGEVGFLTFGTMFDPADVDMFVFDKPLRRLRWKESFIRRHGRSRPST